MYLHLAEWDPHADTHNGRNDLIRQRLIGPLLGAFDLPLLGP